MPSGAKKRKALKKKKKEQETIGSSGFNGHGHDEHGSQVEGESDGSLSSPGSQGNGESWTRDSSPSPLSGLRKVTSKERTEDEDIIAVERGNDHEENGVDKPHYSLPENVIHNTIKAASQEAISKAVISNKDENVESSTHSFCVQQKADENKEKSRLKEAREAAERSKEIKRLKESEMPECSEEKKQEYSTNSGQHKLKEQPTKTHYMVRRFFSVYSTINEIAR